MFYYNYYYNLNISSIPFHAHARESIEDAVNKGSVSDRYDPSPQARYAPRSFAALEDDTVVSGAMTEGSRGEKGYVH